MLAWAFYSLYNEGEVIFMMFPEEIFSGWYHTGHCQGIAVDKEKGYIYYSFTTNLVKTDLQGNVIGSVTGLLGHLGCIDFHEADGKVYGSLEYKNDAIGRGILARNGVENEVQDAFYIVIFDVDKIDRMDMDACADGVMKGVWLRDVLEDYKAEGHRYGCSGIDGTAFGPMFGAPADSKEYLCVTYGIYSDPARTDNDNQVILCYDVEDWETLAQPLTQGALHTVGPAPYARFFVYTGNTTYGVQNLEYDAHSRKWLMCVYPGHKEQYPNPPLFAIDGTVAPIRTKPHGLDEEGLVLTLDEHGLSGWTFPYGSTGIFAFGDGRFYVSHPARSEQGDSSTVHLYSSSTIFADSVR